MTNTSHNPEAFSRVLIDRALTDSDWALLNTQQVQFEHHTHTGRADYLLKDSIGRVLCVLEAKREDLDPYDAKEQARGYAENRNAPFVILSNGREHWFWNLQIFPSLRKTHNQSCKHQYDAASQFACTHSVN